MPGHNKSFFLEVALGFHPGYSIVNKYGRNPDIDTADLFAALWNGGGDYTGQDPIDAETIEVFSSSTVDAGTLLSSGTVTGATLISMTDSGATFSTDTVAAGDVLINDTKHDHAIVVAVTETKLTFVISFHNTRWDVGDTYRVATKASTGTPVIKMQYLLTDTYHEEEEYLILNGQTAVDTVGTYIRHSRAKCHGGDNAGAITARQKTTTANITMVMPATYNSTMIGAYTLPVGKRALAVSWFTALAKKQSAFSNVRLMFRPVNDVFRVAEELTLSSTATSFVPRVYTLPKDEALFVGSDIKMMADASADNMGVAGGFSVLLVDV